MNENFVKMINYVSQKYNEIKLSGIMIQKGMLNDILLMKQTINSIPMKKLASRQCKTGIVEII